MIVVAADDRTLADDGSAEGGVNMPAKSKRWTHVRVPVDLAARLAQLADRTHAAYVAGRVNLPGSMAGQVPVWLVIQRALDEQEARRARSRRPRRKS